jgi:hypothetical protein
VEDRLHSYELLAELFGLERYESRTHQAIVK